MGGGKGIESYKIHRFAGNRGETHDSGKGILGAIGKLPPVGVCLVKTEGLAFDAFLPAVNQGHGGSGHGTAVSHVTEILLSAYADKVDAVGDGGNELITTIPDDPGHTGCDLIPAGSEQGGKESIQFVTVSTPFLPYDLFIQGGNGEGGSPLEFTHIKVLKGDMELVRIDEPVQIFLSAAGTVSSPRRFR